MEGSPRLESGRKFDKQLVTVFPVKCKFLSFLQMERDWNRLGQISTGILQLLKSRCSIGGLLVDFPHDMIDFPKCCPACPILFPDRFRAKSSLQEDSDCNSSSQTFSGIEQ